MAKLRKQTNKPPAVVRAHGEVRRLHPDQEQKKVLEQWMRVARVIFNLGLEQRNRVSELTRQTLLEIFNEWKAQDARGEQRRKVKPQRDAKGFIITSAAWDKKQGGKPATFGNQSSEYTELRGAVPWIKEMPYDSGTYALRNVDDAFRRYYATGTSGRLARYPRFRRFANRITFSGKDRTVNNTTASMRKGGASKRNGGEGFYAFLGLPKEAGLVPYTEHREIQGVWGAVNVKKRVNDHWYLSTATDFLKIPKSKPKKNTEVGIDLGLSGFGDNGKLKNFLVFSNGAVWPSADDPDDDWAWATFATIKKLGDKIRHYDNQLSRKERGSASYNETRERKRADLIGDSK